MMMPAQQIDRSHGNPRVPFFVPLFNPIARRMLRGGLPLGPNALLTVRGRSSGVDRTTPVAVVAIGGRRWGVAPFGGGKWGRKLGGAGGGPPPIKPPPEGGAARGVPEGEAGAIFCVTPPPHMGGAASG